MNPTETSPGPPAPTTSCSAWTTRTHSASVGASGFSHMTGFPAWTAATARSAWEASGEATTTASTAGSPMSATPSSVARTPGRAAATSCARSRSRSATMVTVAPVTCWCRVLMWSAPMMPVPITPTRTVISAREPGDGVADELYAHDQAQHGHHGGVVAGHPVLEAVQEAGRPLAHGEVDDHRRGHADAGQDAEHRPGPGLLAAGDAGLGHRGHPADDEEEVLGVDGAEHEGGPGRLGRGEVVKGSHPLGHGHLLPLVGPGPPLAHRDQDQQQADGQLSPVDPAPPLAPPACV